MDIATTIVALPTTTTTTSDTITNTDDIGRSSLYVCIRVRLFTLSSSYVHNPLDRVMVRG